MASLHEIKRAIHRFGLTDRRYRFLFEAEPENEAVSLDCETTGFDPWADDIVSVAAVRVTNRRIQASGAFRALVRPDSAMGPAAIKVHRLRHKDLADARPMTDVLPSLLHFIGSRPLVGYWIDFDVRMLDRYMLAMFDTRLPNRRIDVSKLYYDRKYGAAPPGTRLDLRYAAIMADLGLPTRPQHDAFEDALGAAEMYLILDDMQRRGARFKRRAEVVRGHFSMA
jgi:DNA polymerase III subunit epsilon